MVANKYHISYCTRSENHSIAFDNIVLCLNRQDLIKFYRDLEMDELKYKQSVDPNEKIFIYKFDSEKMKLVLSVDDIHVLRNKILENV